MLLTECLWSHRRALEDLIGERTPIGALAGSAYGQAWDWVSTEVLRHQAGWARDGPVAGFVDERAALGERGRDSERVAREAGDGS